MAEIPIKGIEIWACRWKDAHYNSNEFERHEIVHRPVEYITTGILLRNDQTGVAIATDICEANTFRGINAIPRELVLDTWKIGVLTKRANRRISSKPIAQDELASHSIEGKQ